MRARRARWSPRLARVGDGWGGFITRGPVGNSELPRLSGHMRSQSAASEGYLPVAARGCPGSSSAGAPLLGACGLNCELAQPVELPLRGKAGWKD